jgi:hypothetical protein
MSKLTDARICVYTDAFAENSFTIKTTEIVFARLNKIGKKWYVWFYPYKFQKEYLKIRDALHGIEQSFIQYFKSVNK